MVKTLFIGTSEFAVPILEAILSNELLDLVGIVTQPDRPVGRHHTDLQPTPVKEHFLKNIKDIKNGNNVKLFQPEKIRDEAEVILQETIPELIIVAAYGQIIPKKILDFPKYKALNIHGSVLPKLRGAVPIQMAILQGFKETGVTIQVMAPEMDAGDIIATDTVIIEESDNSEILIVKLSKLGAGLLNNTIKDWIEGKIKAVPQNESEATFCYKKDLAKENAEIGWKKPVTEIDRMIKAYYPWPVAWTKLKSSEDHKQDRGLEAESKSKGLTLKIFNSKILDPKSNHKKGGKLFRHGKRLLAMSDVGWLEILECQLEGKKRLPAKEYLYLANDKTERVRGILIHDGKILTIFRRRAGKEFHILPGGSVGVSESREDALIREFKEETNLDIKVGKFVKEVQVDEINNHIVHEVELLGSVEDMRMNGEENQYDPKENYYELQWIPLEEARKMDIRPGISEYLVES